MSQRKRSERQGNKGSIATLEEVKPKAPVLPRGVTASLQALCPVCGRAIPERRATAKSNLGTLETKPYFETIEWDPNKPFGVRLPTSGRGSFKDWEYIDKEDAPELFDQLKHRFLEGLKEWLDKGWLSKKELSDLLNRGVELPNIP